MICIEDAVKSEHEYTHRKFGDNIKFVDVEARNSFPNAPPSILKSTIKFNYYTMRDILINEKIADNSCLQCNNREDWIHIIKYHEIDHLKAP